jgi:hypothetical protein
MLPYRPLAEWNEVGRKNRKKFLVFTDRLLKRVKFHQRTGFLSDGLVFKSVDVVGLVLCPA